MMLAVSKWAGKELLALCVRPPEHADVGDKDATGNRRHTAHHKAEELRTG